MIVHDQLFTSPACAFRNAAPPFLYSFSLLRTSTIKVCIQLALFVAVLPLRVFDCSHTASFCSYWLIN